MTVESYRRNRPKAEDFGGCIIRLVPLSNLHITRHSLALLPTSLCRPALRERPDLRSHLVSMRRDPENHGTYVEPDPLILSTVAGMLYASE